MHNGDITGTEVRRLRRKLGLTQGQLAARLGVHIMTVARWEWGTVRVTEPMARLLRLQVQISKPTMRSGRRRATTVPTTPKGGRRR